MFKLHAVQAKFGDSLILEFGTAAARKFILIDGGPKDVFSDDLAAAIKAIVKTKKLALVALSHIDNDHIVGLLDLLAALEEDDANDRPRRVGVAGLWHNSFSDTIDPTGEITARMQTLMTMAGSTGVTMPLAADSFFGVKEGRRLRILAKKLKIPVNKGFDKDLVLVETAPDPISFGSLKLQVVGPNKANLEELRKEWIKWLEKSENILATNPETLANTDKSVPNLSSIVLLAKCEGKTILLTGDARSDHVLSGLEQAGALNGGKLHVDILKMMHHGSIRNVNQTFLKKITADKYLISADGTNDNPDLETLELLVETAKAAGRQIEIIVTNATPSTKKIKQTHKPADFGYTLTIMPQGDHSIPIELA